MHDIFQLASHGLSSPDLALTGLRIATGAFFVCSGANKLFVASRHQALVQTLETDHVPLVKFNQWHVPCWEFFGGMALAVGIYAGFAAVGLLILMLVACKAEAGERVKQYAPINRLDTVADWLYIPEILYALLLGTLLIAGMGFTLV